MSARGSSPDYSTLNSLLGGPFGSAPGSPTYSFLSDLNSVQQDLNEVPDDALDEIDSGFAEVAHAPARTPSTAGLLLQAPQRVESALAMVRQRGTSHDAAERAVGLPAGTLAALVDARGQWLNEHAMAPLLETLSPHDVQPFFNAIAAMRQRLEPPAAPARHAPQQAPDADPRARDKGKARLPD